MYCFNIVYSKMECIIRTYPKTRELSSYPFRFTQNDFNKYRELLNNGTLQDDYEKWKIGINYKTNKRITINGKMHQSLKSVFMIRCDKGHTVLFDDFKSIDFAMYSLETKTIYETIDATNKEINHYNDAVKHIIENINNLNKWNDFICFESSKYGIPIVVNRIHKENDCLGEIIEYYESCSCSSCENWSGCNRGGTYHHECNKCSYKTQTNAMNTRNYKGQ
jgi:hypothetical protein